eukprot:scaffold5380_cov131-Cylindrotheca_fusiformis.AAC.4
MDQQQISGNAPRQRSLSDAASATKLQAVVRGFLLRQEILESNFKAASSRGFPIRVVVPDRRLRRLSSGVSAITMYDSDRSLLNSYYEETKEEHPGFALNDEASPVRCPRRIASKESNTYMLENSNDARLLTLDEDEENHPGFENDLPVQTRTPVRKPMRVLSIESEDSESLSDEGSLLFSPTSVDAAFNSSPGEHKKASMLSFSPLPFARGQRALGRVRTRQSSPGKLSQDLPACPPKRQMSTDGPIAPTPTGPRRE